MENIVWILSSILTLGIVGIVCGELNATKKSKKNPVTNVLRPNKLYFTIGIFGGIVSVVFAIMGWFLDTSTAEYQKVIYVILIILLMGSLSGYLVFFYLNYKVIVYEEYFIYQNFWRIKKKIYYKDIVIDRRKMHPQVRLKKDNGKTKLIFKLAGVLENEVCFTEAYKAWKSKPKKKKEETD